MIRTIILIPALALTFLLISCQNHSPNATDGDPESQVRAFYDAVLNNDLEAMEATLSRTMDGDLHDLLYLAFASWQGRGDRDKDAIRIDELRIRENGDDMEAYVTFKAGSPDTWTLVNEQGTWLLLDHD